MNRRIYIRVDGNEIIATGHVMRCLSIAVQLRSLGAEVIFLVADERPCDLITTRGFSVEVLHTIWNDLNQETDMLYRFLREHQDSVLLLDSYYVTPEYMWSLSQVVQVVYIDDLNAFLYPVHAVINYGRGATQIGYEQAYAKKHMDTHFLLGSDYIPLREEFAFQPYVVRQDMKQVLITMGGTDTWNVTGHLLNHVLRVEELAQLDYHVIVGCFNIHKDFLHALSEQYSNIFLHENVNNMSAWMRSCDVAVSASGSTLYELCACGTPAICVEIADNQSGAESWETDGYMYYGGDVIRDMDECMEQCVKRLLDYKHHADIRSANSRKMQSLVDGNGAKRIAEWMIS